APHHLSYQGR
ncbi:hypothetical protein D030_2167B, partial [Vibrio parahaemolyticus AQ3810]